MKQQHLVSILECNNLPIKELEVFVREKIPTPIFKITAKRLFDVKTGAETATSEYLCSNCGQHFVLQGSDNHYVECPQCGIEDSAYSTQVLTGIPDDFSFEDDTVVEIVKSPPNTLAGRYGTYAYKTSKDDSLQDSSKVYALAKYNFEKDEYFVLHHCSFKLETDIEQRKKKIVIECDKNAVIFAQNEIIHIKEGRRSAMPVKATYVEKFRTIVSNENDAVDFRALVDKLETEYGRMNILLRMYDPELDSVFFNGLNSMLSVMKAKRKSKKGVSKRQQQLMSTVDNLPIPKSFIKNTDKIIYTVREIDEITNLLTVDFSCPNCGETITTYRKKIPYFRNGADFIECKHCQSTINGDNLYNGAYLNTQKATIVIVQDYEAGIAIRDYLFQQKYDGGIVEYIPDKNYKSQNIVFIPTELNRDNLLGSLSIMRKNYSTNLYSTAKTLQIKNNCDFSLIYNESSDNNIKWSGVETLNAHIPVSSYASVEKVAAYLALFKAFPVLEKFQKAGLSELTCDVINTFNWEQNRVNSKYALYENELHNALRISKLCLKLLGTYPKDKSEHLHRLQVLYFADKNLTAENYQYIINNEVKATEVADICRKFDFTIHQVCEYLERVRIAQCLSPRTAISEWSDYLNASKLIGCDFTDRRVKYPAALRTEHDKVMYKRKIIENREIEERFCKTTQEYGEKFSHNGEKYIITYPKTLSDLFEEGRNLNHCVGSYGDSILSGDRIILFVREKSKPSIPYFTLEVRPEYNAVGQFYGHSNTPPTIEKNKDLITFVKGWAKKHNIIYA